MCVIDYIYVNLDLIIKQHVKSTQWRLISLCITSQITNHIKFLTGTYKHDNHSLVGSKLLAYLLQTDSNRQC